MTTDTCAPHPCADNDMDVITYSYAGHTATFPADTSPYDLATKIRTIHGEINCTPDIREERARHRRELDHAMQARQRAANERAEFRDERDEALQRVQDLRVTLKTVMDERNQLRNEVCQLDGIGRERDKAREEANDTQAANRALRADIAELRVELAKARDGSEVRRIRDERNTMRRARDYYRDELNKVSGGWPARRELDDQIARLTKERDNYRDERDGARAARDAAIWEARDADRRLQEVQECLTGKSGT